MSHVPSVRRLAVCSSAGIEKAWEPYLLPVLRIEAFALPSVVERATLKPTPILLIAYSPFAQHTLL